MNDLFIGLYLDEDVDVLVAVLLKARQFVAMSTRDAGRLGSSDEEQLRFAGSERLALVTHNRVDFEALVRQYAEIGQTHAGVIIASRRSPYDVAHRLLVILDQITTDEMRDNVIYI